MLPRVRNYRVDVLEEGDRVVFLHRVVPGQAGRSYGIHVARLAGVPRAVTRRAEEVLAGLEAVRGDSDQSGAPPPAPVAPGPALTNGHPAVAVGEGRGTRKGRGAAGTAGSAAGNGATTVTTLQLTLFGPSPAHPVVEELQGLDVMALTPLEALNRLAALAERARKG